MNAGFIIRSCRRNIFPLYHTVSDVPLPHIGDLYAVRNVKQFTRDLEILCRSYTPATMEETAAVRPRGQRPLFHLTFDDGLKECATVIAPFLLQKGIPASFFINNDFIDNRRLFYRFVVSLLLEKNPAPVLAKALEETGLPAGNPRMTLLKMSHRDEDLLRLLAVKLNLDTELYLREKQPYMSAEDIGSLLKNGFTIGSHSCSHADFSLLGAEEMIREITSSVNDLNLRFGIRCTAFSFPFSSHMLSVAAAEAVMNGVPGIKYFFGTSGIKDDLPGMYQRIPFEKSNQSATAILVRQTTKYRLQKMAGRQRVKRKG